MATDIDTLEKQKKEQEEQVNKEGKEAEKLAEVSHLLPKPKGILFKKCPNDGRSLKKEHWTRNFYAGGGFGHITIIRFSCDCGYKYATVK